MVNPFPHTTILQQTTLKIFCQKIEYLYNWMDNLWLKLVNIVAKGEIAHLEQFLLLSLCFQRAACCRGCRGVRKRLYEGKGLFYALFILYLDNLCPHADALAWLQQIHFENIVVKEKLLMMSNFSFCLSYCQLYSIIIYSFIDSFHISA